MKKLVLLVLICISCKGVFAQKTKLSLDHIAFFVKDVNKSAAFYASVFDLDSIPDPFPTRSITWFRINKETQLHLIQSDGDSTSLIPYLNHLCFSISKLDDFIKNLNSRQISYTDWGGKPGSITVRGDGIRQIYIRDPDGYLIEINDATK